LSRSPKLRSKLRAWLGVAALAALVLTPACSGDDDNPTSPTPPCEGPRIGAVCNDGTHSEATGSGACSHHGGVHHWLYADC
jgi:hypothetical protein